MRLRHFETLQPVCPSCRSAQALDPAAERVDSPLEIGWVAVEQAGSILEGGLYCTSPRCRAEYPIIDGLPVLVPDPRAFVAENIYQFTLRDDLDGRTESLLGECCGPGSALDATRLHLSTYAWDHYAEFDPGEGGLAGDTGTAPGSIAQVWDRIRSLSQGGTPSPVLEVGCSVGRIVFEEARAGSGLVLGVDTNVSMLRLGQRALRDGRIVYPRRRHGLLYDRREFDLPSPHRDNVDFWIADGTALPFPARTFSRVVGLNVIDCTAAPLDLLRSMRDVTCSGGEMLLATPFDWSGAVTPPPAWIGGHSLRAPGAGAGAAILHALLTPSGHAVSLPGVRVTGEIDHVPWTVRLHDRSITRYLLYGLVAQLD